MSAALSDQLQVWGVEEDTIIYTDGSIGFGLELSPIDVSCTDGFGANDIHENLSKFLNTLPTGIDIQFIQEISDGNEKVISENEKLCELSKSELIKGLNLKKVDSLRELDSYGLLPVHKLKLIVRKPLTRSILTKKSIFSNDRLFPEISEKNLNHEVKTLKKLKSEIKGQLNKLGLSISDIPTQKIVSEVYNA